MKKISFANICACASLFISMVLLVLWCCNVGGFTVVSLDSFVGVIVALLAIIVTLAVAWQIYNAIDIRNKIDELKKLEDDIKDQKKSFEQFRYNTTSLICGLGYREFMKSDEYISAFQCALDAIEALMKLEDSDASNAAIDALESINGEFTEVEIDTKELEEIKKTYDSIKTVPHFNFIKNRIEKIYSDFLSKVKSDEEKQ